MIIKYKKRIYPPISYGNNTLEVVQSYKYLGINFNCRLKWNHNVKKRIIGGWKVYYGLENKCRNVELWYWDKKKLFLKL
jgi:hypothetical protein